MMEPVTLHISVLSASWIWFCSRNVMSPREPEKQILYHPCVLKPLFLTLPMIPYRRIFWESVNYLKIVGKISFLSCCELSWPKQDCSHAFLYTHTLKVEERWTVSSVTESPPQWGFTGSSVLSVAHNHSFTFFYPLVYLSTLSVYTSLILHVSLSLSLFFFLSVFLLVCLCVLLVIFGAWPSLDCLSV